MFEWISVKERLPSEKWVLVSIFEKGKSRWVLPRIAGYREKENGWWVSGIGVVSLDDEVLQITHWMLLPEPPKEEKYAQDDF